jgi:hypothetical protein
MTTIQLVLIIYIGISIVCGFVFWCCCVAGKRADERTEEILRREKDGTK